LTKHGPPRRPEAAGQEGYSTGGPGTDNGVNDSLRPRADPPPDEDAPGPPWAGGEEGDGGGSGGAPAWDQVFPQPPKKRRFSWRVFP